MSRSQRTPNASSVSAVSGLEQQPFRSFGTFEPFLPLFEFIVRELTASVSLAENRQRLRIVLAGFSIEERIDDGERDGDEKSHPEESPEPHRTAEEVPSASAHHTAVAPGAVSGGRSSRRDQQRDREYRESTSSASDVRGELRHCLAVMCCGVQLKRSKRSNLSAVALAVHPVVVVVISHVLAHLVDGHAHV